MKQLLSNSAQTNPAVLFNKINLSRSRFKSTVKSNQKRNSRSFAFLSSETRKDIASGALPNLEKICFSLVDTFQVNNYPFKAVQFLDVLKNFELTKQEINQLVKHNSKKHVLIENQLLKVVLILWESNDTTSIHGHHAAGCVFKVLKGNLVETRYSPDSLLTPLATSKLTAGALAYIDDSMAYHAVKNSSKRIAISLHVYTPGTNPQ